MRRFAATVAVLALLTACGPERAGPAPPPAPANPADSFESSTTYESVARPTRIRIPALRVDSQIIDLGLQPDGAVEVPASVSVAGWYDGGPRPGQDGPAVILGHVDSADGPGVFVDLHKVKPGTLVEVGRADGSTATFKVSKVSRVAKTLFPTDLVYAPSLDPTLRLVTCGGTFDRARGSYRDNVIAYADAA
ncbi:class F sortase [Paractinoplanes abujensis]|uniref:Sortase (Surface protein transpeptidase) n=1 Tax=Paractinoplanes abujensis TaxID=882441 RepID=A0A7W7CN10_9ACTN|nr:class F sortase [Actinoplanes abujensis]MBB4691279.1 sortase (surface protein transpeptidase) [Actinoplanes abujensis]GID17306.1 class F sortase [Actinoplanes abujensis]